MFTATPENNLQLQPDSYPGEGVLQHGVPQQVQEGGAGHQAGVVRNSDQDLVPEQEGQGQEDGEGGGRPAVQVRTKQFRKSFLT